MSGATEGQRHVKFFTIPNDPGPKPAGIESLSRHLQPDVMIRFHAGEPLGARLLEGRPLRMSAKAGNQMTDFLYSVNRALVASERARAFFEAQGLTPDDIEFIPFQLLDKKGKPRKERYFIANPLRVVACMDPARSTHKPFPSPSPGQPRFFIRKLHVEEGHVPADARLFRLYEDPQHVLIRSDLLDALKVAGLTGLVERELGGFLG